MFSATDFFLYFFTGCRNNNSTASSNNAYNVNSSQPLASYNIGSLSSGTGAGAITMAAAQAVQATAQVPGRVLRQMVHSVPVLGRPQERPLGAKRWGSDAVWFRFEVGRLGWVVLY